MKRKLFLFLLIGLAFSVLGLQTAQALEFGLNYEYSGGTEPQGSRPWLTATFENGDFDGDGDGFNDSSVMLTLDATGLIDDEFVTKWAFNFEPTNPLISVSSLIFYHQSGPMDNFIDHTIDDAYKAGPAHGFDILFDFHPGFAASRFGARDTSIYFIGPGPGLIFDDDFDAENSTGKEPFIFTTAAHVQGIPIGEGSGWIAPNPNPVPEPATMLLVGVGLFGLAGFGRRRFKA